MSKKFYLFLIKSFAGFEFIFFSNILNGQQKQGDRASS